MKHKAPKQISFNRPYLTKIDKIFFLLVFILSIFLSIFVYDVPNVSVMADSNLYMMKRVVEKVILLTKRTPLEKVMYQLVLLDERLKELQNVVLTKKYTLFLSSSLRYSSLAGEITQETIAGNIPLEKVKVQEEFARHKKIFIQLLDKKGNNANDNWKFIQDDINYLTIYSEKLSNKN